MADCCQPRVEPAAGQGPACPSCGQSGHTVDEVTLKALLKPEALARRAASEHRFCPTPACPIVYFGKDVAFCRAVVGAPVFQKETAGRRIVCHCLDVDESTIQAELAASGSSPSVARIKALVQAKACACEVRNPQGTCCLGNVAAVVAAVGCVAAVDQGVRGMLR